jgi:D-beta-D-heptose 7-phosphate kinase/D-beta-D-heptose 1-phosphate adenosyltransferase
VNAPPGRLLTLDAAAVFVADVRARGGRVAFTNGVFDLLHPGHAKYLAEARALADALVVALNSDRSVRAIKGPARPVNRERHRAEVLLALASVDAAVIFDEDTPYTVISRLQPDVLVKGADWGTDQIVGRDVVEARGGRVVRIALVEGLSSTELIRRARARTKPC